MTTGWSLYRTAMRKDEICRNMTANGWHWDFDNAKRLQLEYEEKVRVASAPLIRYAERLGLPELNFASPKQLADLYFNKFRVAPVLWTDKGKPSLNEDALKVYISGDNPAAVEFSKRLLDVRGYEKLLGTYILGCAPAPGVDKVYGHWKLGPVTGRLACVEVPLQTFPAVMRPLLKAAPGTELVECDKSQLEVRTIAVNADIKLFRQTYDKADGDVYLDVARAMFDKPHLDKREPEGKKFRQLSKRLVLSCNYMAQDERVHQMMYADEDVRKSYPDLTLRQSAALRRSYLRVVPELPVWWSDNIAESARYGEYVERYSGTRVPFYGPVDGSFVASYKNQRLASFLVDAEWIEIYDGLQPGEEMKGQVHDAVVAQSARGADLEARMVKAMTTELTYEGRHIHLPCEAKRSAKYEDCK